MVAVTDSSGTVVEKHAYGPYGEIGGSTSGFPFRFTGQKLDAETGLYYYKARYYDPETGRFLQTDPIGYADQMNLYAYVGNDPVNATDPSGLAEREVERKVEVTGSYIRRTVSVTVEAGDLSQTQTEDALSGVSDSFFTANDGQNLSSYAKPVTGGRPLTRDRVRVQTQVAGRAIDQRGNASLRASWANISGFKINNLYKRAVVDGRVAGVNADNPPGPGAIDLYNDYFGRSGVEQIQTLIHEAFHDTAPGMYPPRLVDNCRRGRKIDCMGLDDIETAADDEATRIMNAY